MNAQSYAEQSHAITARPAQKNEKTDKSREALFGLVLTLTALYGIGSLIAFVTSLVLR